MNETTYYQRNRKIILNRAKEYDKNNKEKLVGKARNNYRELSDEEKNIKREYGRNRHQNMYIKKIKKTLKNTKKIIVKERN